MSCNCIPVIWLPWTRGQMELGDMCLKLAVEHVKIYTLKICECSICVLDLIKAIFVYKNVTYNLSFFIFYLAVLPLRTDQVTGPSNVVD